MNNDINKTLENITESLKENALPKAAPTQFGINCPPHQEIDIRCGFGVLCTHDSCDYQIHPVIMSEESLDFVDAAIEHCRDTGHIVNCQFYIRVEEIMIRRDIPIEQENLKNAKSLQ